MKINKSSLWKLNDQTLKDEDLISKILENCLPLPGNVDCLSQTYDKIKTKVRDLLPTLCIKRKREEIKLEKTLLHDIRQPENHLSRR